MDESGRVPFPLDALCRARRGQHGDLHAAQDDEDPCDNEARPTGKPVVVFEYVVVSLPNDGDGGQNSDGDEERDDDTHHEDDDVRRWGVLKGAKEGVQKPKEGRCAGTTVDPAEVLEEGREGNAIPKWCPLENASLIVIRE